MRNWKDKLERSGLLLADGAWGTELAKAGLPAGEAPEAWNLQHPDRVQVVAAAYVEAGADIVLTNTFGGSRLKLRKLGLEDSVAEVNRTGAQLSRAAAGDGTLVFASVGPTGEFMAPLGPISEDEMVECFAEQIAALADGGADGILIETMTDVGEAKAALHAARDACDLPVVVSMTFDKGPKGYATMMGVKPDKAAAEMTAAGADVVGTNCGSGIVNIIDVIRIMRGVTELPLWAKPNAGLPQLVDGQTMYRETPDEMASYFAKLAEAGASIIGGCCGTTPEHIRRFAAERDRLLTS